MIWRTGIIFAFVVSSAALAWQIGNRLNSEAVMTIIGVSCGIAASIPVSIGLLIALTRSGREDVLAEKPTPQQVERWNVYAPPPPQLSAPKNAVEIIQED